VRDVIRKSLFNDNRIKFREIHSLLQKYFEDEANREVPRESCESEKYTNPDWSQYTAEAIYHAFFNLSREDGKRYFLTHFFTSRFFNQIEVVIAPFAAITAEIEISDKNLLPHENRKFLENLERISPYFLVVWFMIISQPMSEIKVNETQLTREEVEGIENIIKIFLRYVDSLPDGLCKYIGLAGKLSRCNDSQKVEIVKQLEIQSKFLKNKIKSEYSSHIFYFVGLIYLSLHRYEEANVSFDESINLRKDIPEVWNNRGIANANLEKYEEAIADYNEAINLKSDYISAWNNRGIAKAELEKYQEAISDYDEAIKLKLDLSEAWNNRGNSKNFLKKYEEAIADLDEAIKLNSFLPEAWNNRGIAKANLEKYQEAIADFDEAIKLKSDYNDAWNNRGLAKAELEKYQEAIADFDKAIKLNPDDNKAFMNTGYVFTLLEKYDEALSEFDIAIKLQENYSEAWLQKAIILTRLNRYEEALNNFNKALEIAPDDIRLQVSRGVLFGWIDQHIKSLEICDMVLNNNHNNVDVLYAKSCCYALQKNIEDSVKYLDLAIAQKPNMIRKRARRDPEFNGIREDSRFQELVNG
jgi:tetratricopeptide (TPR) repeat protein